MVTFYDLNIFIYKSIIMGQSEKQKLWKINHYNENKDFYKSKQSERRKLIKEYVESKKKMCISCGESDVACLDFHHLNGEEKDKSLTYAIVNKWGQERIDNEISKCVVLCSNCHRKLHYYNLSVEEVKEMINENEV